MLVWTLPFFSFLCTVVGQYGILIDNYCFMHNFPWFYPVLPSFLLTFVGPELRRELLSPVTGQDIWERLAPWSAKRIMATMSYQFRRIHWDYTVSHCDIGHKFMWSCGKRMVTHGETTIWVMTNSSPWRITMLLNAINRSTIYKWVIYTMAMLNNQRVIYMYIF